MEPLYLVARIHPRPDRVDEARLALQDLIDGSLQEPGCEMYDLVVSDEDPNTWVMVEKWSSREAWDAHMETEHNRRFTLVADDLLTTPNTWTLYRPV